MPTRPTRTHPPRLEGDGIPRIKMKKKKKRKWNLRKKEPPISCFVRGGKQARVELLARHISTKSQYWGTLGMFRCSFGVGKDCTDPDYDTPTSDCLATTGQDMFTDQQKYIGRRLPPKSKDTASFRNPRRLHPHTSTAAM